MTDRFPTLHEMGVTNPSEIVSYDLIQNDDNEDILRLRYKRPSGSFLPVTRVYHFGRTPRASATSDSLIETEIAPTLSAALVELDTLVHAKSDRKVVIGDLRERMGGLEAEIRSISKELQRIADLD